MGISILWHNQKTNNFDTDMDGFISKKEAEAVKEIDLSNVRGEIHSLAGIEYFTSIEKLSVNHTSIESLDLSANSMLEILDCSGNPYLLTLALPESKRLKSLNCSNTKLESVNLNGYAFLEDFTFINAPNFSAGTLSISNSSVKRVQCDNFQNLHIHVLR
jgi:Leucine-rich repeat (LRR) protein